jgi:hypothetical protein
MNAFKRITLTTIVATAALTLTACSGGGSAENRGSDDKIKSYAVTFDSGTAVDCVVFEDHRQGGVSCFWGEKSTAKETSIYLHPSVGIAAGAERSCIVFAGNRAGGIDCDTRSR